MGFRCRYPKPQLDQPHYVPHDNHGWEGAAGLMYDGHVEWLMYSHTENEKEALPNPSLFYGGIYAGGDKDIHADYKTPNWAVQWHNGGEMWGLKYDCNVGNVIAPAEKDPTQQELWWRGPAGAGESVDAEGNDITGCPLKDIPYRQTPWSQVSFDGLAFDEYIDDWDLADLKS
jgi:hypothetical protein